MATLTKKDALTLAPRQEGEASFVRQKLIDWGVPTNLGIKTLNDALSSDQTPSNVRLLWSAESPDLFDVIGGGFDCRKPGPVLATMEAQLQGAMKRYSEEQDIPTDFVGVAFRVKRKVFIYATEAFPRKNVFSAAEDPDDNPTPGSEREGGEVIFSAGPGATRRIIIAEQLAQYDQDPNK